MFYSIDELKTKLGISLRDAYRLVHSKKIALLYKVKMPRLVDDLEPVQGEDGRTVIRQVKVIQGFKESMTLLPPEYLIKLITGDDIFTQDDVLTKSALNEKTLLNEFSIFVTSRDFDKLTNLPTIDQLQAENESLKQRIEELEANQSTDNSEPTGKSKASINAFFKALNASHPSLNVKKIADKSSDLGNPISESVIYKYLKTGI